MTSLDPVEAWALLHPKRQDGRRAARLALAALITGGHLRITVERRRRFLIEEKMLHIVRPPQGASSPPSHLRPVLDGLQIAPGGEETIGPTVLLHRLQKSLGIGLGRYMTDHLLPHLVARGLMRVEIRRVLGVFPARRHHLTPEGERARAEVAERVGRAETLPALLMSDPPAAARTAAELGGYILLAESLRPHRELLAATLRDHGTSDTSALLEGLDEERRGEGMLEALDTFSYVDWDAVFDAVDGSIDGGGDGSGGDGGGDGGGGGGGD